jgi:single-strand DNA-binding protein
VDLNKVFIIGRLTADPVIRSTPTGQQVASFSLATNRVWKDKNGAKQEEVEYHNIVAWGRQAEIASQFLTKGSVALIEGRLKTRTWQNKEGQNVKTTEIISDRLQLGPRPAGASFNKGGNSSQNVGQSSSQNNGADISQVELPQIDINEEDIKPEDLPF